MSAPGSVPQVDDDMRERRTIPIVALDVPTAAEARALVAKLGGSCRFYKVGLELYAAEGPDIVRWLVENGNEVFVDLKLHDIPNTVRSAARAVARLGASLLTVHASGGVAMMQAAVEGAREGAAMRASAASLGNSAGVPACGILGVTVLTSHDAESQASAWGRLDTIDVSAEVLRLASDTHRAGGAGIVCSGHEAARVHQRFGPELGLLIPGIRLEGGSTHDQKRVMTAEAAQRAGARWIILGRAVTQSNDPLNTMQLVQTALTNQG